MAQTIKIKRSSANGTAGNSFNTPTSLENGELAYLKNNTHQKLYIGNPGGGAGDISVIGGKDFTDKLDLIGAANGSSTADARVVASSTNLGVVRIGSGLNIASNGVVSADEVDSTSVSNAGAVMTTGSTMGSSSTLHFPFGSKITMGDADSQNSSVKNFEISCNGGSSGSRNILLQENGGGSITIQGESLFLMHADGNDAIELTSSGTDTVTVFRSNGSEVARVKSGAFAVQSSAKLTVNDIEEASSGHGVVVDGVTLKDGEVEGNIKTDLISEKTAANGVVIDSVTLKDGSVIATGEVEGGSLDINGAADISGGLSVSGDSSINGNLFFSNNKKIQMGTTNSSTNLEIYTDGSNSIIEENRSGNLTLRGTNLNLQAADDTNFLQAVLGGAVTLYHTTSDGSGGYNATPRVATSSSGATVSGSLTVTGDLNITGDVNSTSVTDLDVTDKTITVGVGQAAADSSNSGITVAGADAKIVYEYDTGTNTGIFEIDQGQGAATQSAILTAANWGTEYTGAVDGGTF